jgi:hypothetical protein
MTSPNIVMRDHEIRLAVTDEDGNELEVITLVADVAFKAGTPESGTRGPPENYDPGSGDEVWFDKIMRVIPVTYGLAALDEREHAWADRWLELNKSAICERVEDDEPDPDEAREREFDAARDLRWSDEP